MKKNIFRSRLFLCAPAAFCLCATLLCACSAQGNAVSASVHEQALAQLKAQDAELQALTEQVAELKAALADAQRAAVLEDTRTERCLLYTSAARVLAWFCMSMFLLFLFLFHKNDKAAVAQPHEDGPEGDARGELQARRFVGKYDGRCV